MLQNRTCYCHKYCFLSSFFSVHLLRYINRSTNESLRWVSLIKPVVAAANLMQGRRSRGDSTAGNKSTETLYYELIMSQCLRAQQALVIYHLNNSAQEHSMLSRTVEAGFFNQHLHIATEIIIRNDCWDSECVAVAVKCASQNSAFHIRNLRHAGLSRNSDAGQNN